MRKDLLRFFRFQVVRKKSVLATCDTVHIKNSIALGVPADGEVCRHITDVFAFCIEQFDRRLALIFVSEPARVDDGHRGEHVAGGVGVRRSAE